MSSPPLSDALVRLMAITCGVFAATLWFAQPLLHELSRGLSVSEGAAGFVVGASQLGYVGGLLLIVPRGDSVDRRRLTTVLSVLGAAALAVCAVAPGLPVLVAATAAVGITTAVAQLLVPLAGDLAEPAQRGAVVGRVMGGLLIGILVSRTFSGLVAGVAGWRAVYGVAAALMLAIAAALWRVLPDESHRRRAGDRFGGLRETGRLVAREPELRRRMALGALGLGSFSLLWTALTFMLVDAHGLGPQTIGLFGLAGLAGALSARGAGRLADRRAPEKTTVLWIAISLAGWALCTQLHSILLVVAGLIVYDAGQQGHHITNQTVILGRWPEHRSRVTTAYTSTGFVGATAGSLLASALWAAGGWSAVCLAGAGLSLMALLTASWPLLRYARRATWSAKRASGSSSAVPKRSRSWPTR